MADQQQSSTLLTIGQNIVSAINALKAALTPTSTGLTVGGTAGQIQYNSGGALGGFTASGDATINTGTGAVALAGVIAAAGPIGNSSTIPVITFDAKGRLTAVSTATIAAVTGTLVSNVVYSATQTITIPPGATKALVQMWGASGGSGGVSNGAASGGTGAGGFLVKYLTGLTAGNTLAYTQAAAGGTAGAAGVNAGGNAAAVTLASGTQTISTLTCNGSNGSSGASTTSAGTAGGTATGGDYNQTGQAGYGAFLGVNASFSAPVSSPGWGGVNHFSQGVTGAVSVSGNVAGNAGSPGGLIVMWFS